MFRVRGLKLMAGSSQAMTERGGYSYGRAAA